MARAATADALAERPGSDRVEALRVALRDALEFAGGMEAVRARRAPPVR